MLKCAICGTESPDGIATCPACGEASWLPKAAEETPKATEETPAPSRRSDRGKS